MRSRNIKPGFFKDYELADAGPHAQLLFAGLWCLADKEGRLENKPRFIKAEIFPYYDVDVNGELTVIERLGYIHTYSIAGKSFIQIINFTKHQTPHHTERPSTIPAPPPVNNCNDSSFEINGALTVDSRKSNGGNPPDSLIPDSLIPDSSILKQPQKKPARKNKDSAPEDFTVTEELKAWATELGVREVEAETVQFLDHHKAKGSVFKDWVAAWRTWMRNSVKFSKARQKGNSDPEDKVLAMMRGAL